MTELASPAVNESPASHSIRIDKWLWTARFFKTRTSAAEAVSGGHIHVGGERVKPARKVQAGDLLRIRRGAVEWEVVVQGVAQRRGPASEARTLYVESEASVERRTLAAETRRLTADSGYRGVGKPNRRERRDLDRLKGRMN